MAAVASCLGNCIIWNRKKMLIGHSYPFLCILALLQKFHLSGRSRWDWWGGNKCYLPRIKIELYLCHHLHNKKNTSRSKNYVLLCNIQMAFSLNWHMSYCKIRWGCTQRAMENSHRDGHMLSFMCRTYLHILDNWIILKKASAI